MNMIYSIKSYNYPEAYVCHICNCKGDNLGFIKTEKEGANAENASFRLVNGLANDCGISFESVNFQNHYLRHENHSIKLAENDNTDDFKKSATFYIRAGNFGQGISFESCDKQGYYIRHKDGELRIDSSSKGRDLFKKDSTFHICEPLHNHS
ncbi:MAG: arabinofuranosidase [Symploca sp. SIO2G7]|nr:arabinofuranosidase [Symploca sp. SIO2G7]